MTKVLAPKTRKWIPALAATAMATTVTVACHEATSDAAGLDRVQLTVSGNASSPALSHDGSRLAYATHQCDADGRCTQNIVVQGLDTSGSTTVVRGVVSISRIEWTADGRYLLIDAAFPDNRWGVFSVPSIGGEPRPRLLPRQPGWNG